MPGNEKMLRQETVALLGAGLMGRSMAGHLLQKGYRLFVYNRTPEKVQPLVQAGAETFEHPGAAVEQASVVLLMLSDAAAIENVVFSGGIKDFSGKTFIQMGTIAPEESRGFSFSRDRGGWRIFGVSGFGQYPGSPGGDADSFGRVHPGPISPLERFFGRYW